MTKRNYKLNKVIDFPIIISFTHDLFGSIYCINFIVYVYCIKYCVILYKIYCIYSDKCQLGNFFFVLCEGFPFASGKLAALEFQVPQREVFKSVTTCITRKKDCRIVLFSFSFQFGYWIQKIVNIFSYLVMNHTSKDLSALPVQRLLAIAMLTFVSALRPFYTTTDNL